jgi:hypothetical protein
MMTIVEAGTLLSRVWLPLNSGGLDIGRFTVVCLLAEHTLVRAKDLSFFPFPPVSRFQELKYSRNEFLPLKCSQAKGFGPLWHLFRSARER